MSFMLKFQIISSCNSVSSCVLCYHSEAESPPLCGTKILKPHEKKKKFYKNDVLMYKNQTENQPANQINKYKKKKIQYTEYTYTYKKTKHDTWTNQIKSNQMWSNETYLQS